MSLDTHSVLVDKMIQPTHVAATDDATPRCNTAQDQQDDKDSTASSSETPQTILRGIWALVLGIDEASSIQPDDSFFTLGGDSNAIIRLVSAARRSGLVLSAQDVYQHPRLSELAELAVTDPGHRDDDTPIQPFDLIRDLVKDDLGKCQAQLADLCNVDVEAVEDAYPCTPLQEGLFALSQKAGGAGNYTQQFVLRLDPGVQLNRFMTAWREVLLRSPILRTRITQHEQLGLVQVVVKEEMQWKIVPDLQSYLDQDKAQAMGLGQPLARSGLIMADTTHWIFVFTINHTLYDGGSIKMIQRLLDHCYNTPEEPIAQDLFNRYVRHVSETSRSDASQAFWEFALADYQSTPFPAVNSSAINSTTTTRGPREMMVVERTFSAPQTTDVSLATIIRGAWALLVHSNTGDEDIVFGTTVSGRNAPLLGVEDIIGPTIATVPLRIRVFLEDTAAEFLETLRDQTADMFPHEQTGLQYIAKVSPEAALATDFQTLLVIQPVDDSLDDARTVGTWTETTDTQEFATAYALNLECKLSAKDGMLWRAMFDPLLEEWRIEKLMNQLGYLIRELVSAAAEGKTLADMDLIPPEDREQIWNFNDAPPPAIQRCIHQTIEERASEEPDSPAICSWDGQVTYRELNERSDSLANHLMTLGVGPGTMVPLVFEKGIAVVVAMLAIMKAGGAFVPLDPKPTASHRRLQILDQIQPRMILTSEQFSDLEPGSETRQVVSIGPSGSGSWNKLEGSPSLPQIDPETTTAYVIFTSGSTGQPKGVIVNHSAISTSAFHHGSKLGCTKSSRSFQFASLAFDATIIEVVTVLTHGGCVCMPSDTALLENLNQSIHALDANTLFVTPSVARLVDPEAVPSVTTVMLAGESSTAADFTRWDTGGKEAVTLERKRRLFNGYGPTEASVICALNGPDTIDTVHTSIGTMVGSVGWIVHPENHDVLLPLGAIGELLIEGHILAQGYFGDAEKTAEAFIQDPPWLVQGCAGRRGRSGRLYKTGDMVKYSNTSGSLTYVGRKDSQVKIRGQRVELGEVEHQVGSSLAKSCDVVVEVIYPSGDETSPMIAAFIAPRDDDERQTSFRPTMTAVQTHAEPSALQDVDATLMPIDVAVEAAMADKIPSYMIPTVFFAVTNMPLNTSGKTDRKKLRALGSSFSLEKLAELRSKGGQRRAPKLDSERALQQIWARVLNMNTESIGLDDNFFKIGGDSISAMMLVGAARHEGNVLSMAEVFQNPKLVDQARLLVAAEVEEPKEVLPFTLIRDKVDPQACREDLAESCGLRPEDVEDVYPCTPLQEGFISLSLKMEGDYVLQRVLEIGPSVDLNRLARAWEQLVRYTPILRTRISQHSELGLVQVVVNEALQWTSSENLAEYLEQDKKDLVGLGRPLTRYCLITDRRTRQRFFVWSLHHAVYDGWTMPMMVEQVDRLYHDITAIPTPAPGFNNFVGHILQTSKSASDAFWTDEFKGFDDDAFPVLPSSVAEPNADLRMEKSFTLPDKLDGTGLTPASIVTAAWSLVIYNNTGKTDIIFGNTMAGRGSNIPGIERMLGPTIATIPVRVQMSPHDETPASFVQRIQDKTAQTMPYEQAGLQYITKVSPEAQRVCESFQTLLVIQPPESTEGLNDMPELGRWEDAAKIQDFATYALTLICFMSPAGGMSKIELVYDSRVLDTWRAESLLEQFIFQIEQLCNVAAAPDEQRSISELEVLPTAHSELIWNWNKEVADPIEKTLHELVAERTREHPDAPAVCSWDGNLTYAELDGLSDQVARQLIDLGVGPRTFIPLFFEKSLFAIVAILGVFKSGAAYVALDPTSAEDRRLFVLKKTKARIVLTSEKYADIHLGQGSNDVESVLIVGPSTLRTDSRDPSLKPSPPNSPSRMENPCYVIFTSGSTGTPKGVVLTHRSVASGCTYHGAMIGVNRHSRVLQFSSYAFDASVFEIVTTIIYGGCVCVPSDEDRFEDITKAMVSMSVNTAFFTPSVAKLIDPQRVPHLQTILLGGEASSETDLWRWEHCENIRNLYGPTECSIICSGAKVVPHVTPVRCIGPAVGCTSWVADPFDHDRLVPLGAPGELLIEGPVLAEGYLDDEKKTAEVFIDSPAWLTRGNGSIPGRRGMVYKTGDLVQYDQDGSLLYVSRKDTQVKIRGQRVELGEVEKWVAECFPQARHVVAEVIAVSGEDASSGTTQVLAAFVSLRNDSDNEEVSDDDASLVGSLSSSVTAAETAIVRVLPMSSHVTQQLKRCLPQYMIPNVLFAIDDTRVLSASGKIDRKMLVRLAADFTLDQLVELSRPSCEDDQHEAKQQRRAASTPAEVRLRDLWAKTLKLSASAIGAGDSFFSVGGDSIAAIKLVGESRRVGLVLSVAQIFQNPILSDLAEVVFESQDNASSIEDDTISPFSLLPTTDPDISKYMSEIASLCEDTSVEQVEDAYPCTPLQEGLLSLTAKDSRDYVLQRVLNLAPGVDIARFKRAWEAVVESAPILRTLIVQHPDLGSLQVVSKRMEWGTGENLDEHLAQDRENAMGVGVPLARFALLGHSFVLTVHHCLYDGWALSLLERQLATAYDNDGRVPVTKGPGFNSFLKYTLKSDEEAAHDFWETSLAGYEASQATSFPPVAVAATQGRKEYARIEKHYRLPSSTSSGITPGTVLRAAWALAVYRYTKQADIVFGATVSGRNAPVRDIESIIGPTIATVPVRIRIDEAKSISDYLNSVQAQAISMIPFEQTGLQHITKISPDAQLACDFRTLVVVQPAETPDEGGVDSLGLWRETSDAAAFAAYPLTAIFQLSNDGGIELFAVHDARVLDIWRLERLLDHFEMAINQLSAPTGARETLQTLEYLSPMDKQLFGTWNKDVPTPAERCIQSTIRIRAKKCPDEAAVDAWDGSFTNSELDRLASNLASHLLSECQIKSDTIVPLYFERSKWVLVAILGVLKAGAAFVLMDPTQAANRRRHILDEIESSVVVASELYSSMVSEAGGKSVVIGPSCESVLEKMSSSAPRLPEPDMDALAYVSYTSGSSGRPKGVAVHHKALASSTFYHGTRVGLDAGSRIFQFASYTFDACILELLTSLCFGGCVCIPHEDDRLDIGRSMASLSANVLFSTPTMARMIDPLTVPTLKTIILGGEAVSAEDFERWSHLDRVLNGYGPTETVVFCVVGTYEASSYIPGSIGRPVGSNGWVVDPDNHNRLMPAGAVGELAVEGPIVSRGYLKNEEATRAAFVADPAWLTSGRAFPDGAPGRVNSKLYMTGDLVQYEADGTLSYMGRKDTQVKIRGQRLELNEVQHHVQRCLPHVQQVIAEVIETTASDGESAKANKVLAAFLVQSGEGSNGDEFGVALTPIDPLVETALTEVLPGYMIPTVFFTINKLPLNTAGKTDRRKLRSLVSSLSSQQIAGAHHETQAHKRLPSTKSELALQQIWARVLNLASAAIGLDDSFFRLGGDSILAVHVSSAARAQHLDVSPANVLRNKTIARILQHCSAVGVNLSEPVLQDVDGQVFALSPIQRLYFHLQDDPRASFDQSVLLALTRKVAFPAFEKAMTSIVSSHPILRARFQQSEDGVWEQRITGAEELKGSLHISHHRYESEAHLDLSHVVARHRDALDIENGPLVAAVLLEAEDGSSTQRAFIACHHLVVDIISWHIILSDLESCLTAEDYEITPSLPFPTWATLQANDAKKQSEDSRSSSSDTCATASLETQHDTVDAPSPPPRTYWDAEDLPLTEESTGSWAFALDEETSAALLGARCNDTFQTRPVELMLAALLFSFGCVFSDRPLPTVFNEGHGREPWHDSIDISRTVGWFTSMAPIRLAAAPEATPNSNQVEKDKTETKQTPRLLTVLCQTKDALRGLSHNGSTHFASHFVSQQRADAFMAANYPAEILFNFNGSQPQQQKATSLFRHLPLSDDSKPIKSKHTKRFALFDVVATVLDRQLSFNIIFDRHFNHQQRISSWANLFKATMADLASLLPNQEPEWTLSDFPGAFRSYEDVDFFKRNTMPALGIASIREIEDIFPCSAMQEGILITQIKVPEHYRFALHLDITSPDAQNGSPVDLDRLQRAWKKVVQRHALLRTIFADSFPGAQGTMQIVLQDPAPAITVVSAPLTGTGSATATATAPGEHQWGYTKNTLQHHLTLSRINDHHYDVVIEVNHTIIDGHSVGILIHDLLLAYNSGGVLPHATSYKDFVSSVAKKSLNDGVNYWYSHLAGIEPCFFPTSNDGAVSKTKRSIVKVDNIDTAAIRDFCSQSDFTPASVIQAAWALVLSRYARSSVPCFGVLSSGRDTPVDGIADMLGPTLGMLICRVDARRGRSVLDTLRDIQQDYVNSLAHQHVPLAAVHGALGLGTSALFNSAMSFQRSAESVPDPESSISINIKQGEDPTEYDAAVRVVDGQDISIVVELRGQLSDSQARQIGSCFSSAIASITTNPQGDIKDVDLLGDKERSRIWSCNASVPRAVNRLLHDVVGDRAREDPHSPALWAWDGSMTYAELDYMSGRVAGHLIRLGVGPEVLVPTFFEKTIWTIVAYLGILKAGGAFVPLDPTQAPDRRRQVLEQTGARLVVCSEKYADLPLGDDIQVVSISISSVCFQLSSSDEVPFPASRPQDPSTAAYVIFTSGSTGQPKGVLQTHRSASSGMFHHGVRMGFSRLTRAFQFSSHTFDASIAECFTTLSWGGCVCVPSDADRLERLSASLTVMKANLAIMTPSVARLISPSDVPTLRTIILGGEASSEEDFRRWSHIKAIDGFGPSEAVVFSIVNVIDFSKPINGSIGTPVGSCAFVVDPDDHDILLPFGAVGELLSEGPILAREYVNAPDVTADAFIEDPPWLLQGNPAEGQPGRRGRLYKTKDLVKQAEDGSFTYLGRKDTQVKIRGHRIELGEVEFQMSDLPGVKHAAAEVVRLAGDESTSVLVAFLVVDEDTARSSDKQRHRVEGVVLDPISINPDAETRLAQRLPSYMIPSVVFVMEELPLNTSGKVERKQLRALAATLSLQDVNELRGSGSETTKRLPTTDREAKLQHIWAQLLNIDPARIGLDDNFFRLGGDSIMAMNLVADVRRSGLMLSVATVFQNPKLCDLVEHLTEVQFEDEGGLIKPFALMPNHQDTGIDDTKLELAQLCHVDATSVEDAYPCTPLQEGLLSLTLKTPGDYVLQSVMKLSTNIDLQQFRAAWDQTVASTPILRTRLVQSTRYGLLQVVLQESIKWKTYPTSLDEYLEQDKREPVGLGRPLARFGLVEDGATNGTFFICSMHHAVYDGSAVPLIQNMVTRLYKGLTVDKSVGFNHFVQYLVERPQDADKDYWASEFQDYAAMPFPQLPPELDSIVATSSVEKSFEMPAGNARSTTTQANIMRAAWGLTVSQHTCTHDIAFGVTVSGRNMPIAGIESVVGPTIATVPVRVLIPEDETTVGEYLAQIQDQATSMIPFEQTGLQYIAKASPGASEATQFQTLLVVQQLSGEEKAAETALGVWQQGDQTQEFTTYALTLVYCIAPGATSAKIEASFDPRTIEPWRVESMLEQLAFTIQQFSSGTVDNVAMNQLDIVPPSEMTRLWQWNRDVPETVNRNIHELIHEQVRQHADKIAVEAWDEQMTYAEVDRLSTLLCHHLVNTIGVRPGDIITLSFEKSVWAVVSALAVSKAGGSIGFLDRNQPAERTRDILPKIKAKVLLASGSVDFALTDLVDHTVLVSANSEFFKASSVPALNMQHPSTNIMYIIFTSGTTGVPKAVTVSQRAFSSAVKHQAARMNFTEDLRVYDFASYGFDVAVCTLFMTLAVGGCLYIPSDSARRDNLAASIRESHANQIDLTPSMIRALEPEQVPEITTIIAGGEALQVTDMKSWLSSGVRILNLYGPSECTPQSTINDTAQTPEEMTRIGTGAGVVTWLVQPDNHNRLSPIGTIGELLLEGPLVTDGHYLNDPERTQENFIDDPTWLVRGLPEANQPGRHGRLYMTGDLVRYDGDGSLSFIGRKDTQVKIRGQRVELAEVELRVEECLLPSLGTRQVIVELILPQWSSTPELAAFIATGVREEEDGDENNPLVTVAPASTVVDVQALANRLPSFMIPSTFFCLEKIPLNVSDKVNRNVLFRLGSQFTKGRLAALRQESDKRAPETTYEIALQELWSKTLDLDASQIGADDNFLHLGGNSISAMRLVSLARQSSIMLSVAQVFKTPRLSDLAAQWAEQSASQQDSMDVTVPANVAPFSLLDTGAAMGVNEYRSHVASMCGVDVAGVEDIYPCTPLQEGLFSLSLQRAGDFVLQRVMELPANIDIQRLQDAWLVVLRNNPILRTRFVEHGTGVLQAVISNEHTSWDFSWGTDDLKTYLKQDKDTSMSLYAPLTRFAFIKSQSSNGLTYLVWTVHHALYDAWSLTLIDQQVQQAYRGMFLYASQPFNVFINYCVSVSQSQSDGFWGSTLQDFDSEPFPALPSSMDQPKAESRLDQTYPIYSGQLEAGITSASLIKAAWALTVHHYADTDDVVFGATVSGRNAALAGIEDIIGPSIASLPIRVKISGEQDLASYLQSIQTQAVDMIPFEQSGLQNISKISAATKRASEFQTLLVVQSTEDVDASTETAASTEDDALGAWKDVAHTSQFTTYALTLLCHHDTVNGAANITALFDNNVIDDWRMQNLLDHFGFIMQQLVSARGPKPISKLLTLSPTDSQKLWEWNATLPPSIDLCVHDIISQYTQSRPSATAISTSVSGDVTYAQLDVLSSEIARQLIGLNVTPGTLVPLCFGKSFWAIVAMVGVLKAGAVFVPLDPTQAPERREQILLQTKARIVLTSEQFYTSDQDGTRNRCIAIGPSLTPQQFSVADLPTVDEKHGAYVIFTSGSTGTPKGCLLSHRAISTSAYYHGQMADMNSTSRVLQYSRFSFDASIVEILSTLMHGGCVCVPSDDDLPDNLSSAIHNLSANMAFITPSVARLIRPDSVPSLRTILLAGEASSTEDFSRWANNPPNIQRNILHGYGPTEAAVLCSMNRGPVESVHQSIGRATGCVFWVTKRDDHTTLAPIGTIGELVIEGSLLADGYFGDVEQTDAAFITNPPWLVEGGRQGRVYKTGDLVRYNSDGTLTYVRRKDTQVKIRGQRLELGEIEYQVSRSMYEEATTVVEVIHPEGNTANPALAVFFSSPHTIGATTDVEDEGHAASLVILDSVVEQLSSRLPDYMVPKIFLCVDELPLNSSGKTDRKKLRKLGSLLTLRQLARLRGSNEGVDKEKRAPSTDEECAIQQIWARVLNITASDIGLDDSFFNLGGDSITAMQVSSAAKSKGLAISTANIVRNKTIALILQNQPQLVDTPMTDVADNDDDIVSDSPFPLNPIQQLFFRLQPDPTDVSFDQHLLLRVTKHVAYSSVVSAIKTLVSRHPILTARFRKNVHNGAWEQNISGDVEQSTKFAHQHISSLSEMSTVIQETRDGLDIVHGPLVAAVLFEESSGSQALFLDIHHLVVDIMSWRLILVDLEEILLNGVPPTRPSTIPFHKWATKQYEYATRKHSPIHAASPPVSIQPSLLSYWGMEKGEIFENGTISESFTLDPSVTSGLLGNACHTLFGARPVEFMIGSLLQSFNMVFSDRPLPTVFNENHGRESWDETDLSSTIGWFTTMSPITVASKKEPEMWKAVQLIEETQKTMQGLANQNGWSYFTSQFASEQSAKTFSSNFPAEILFNYGGAYQMLERKDSLFENVPLPEDCSPPASFGRLRRYALFEFIVSNVKNQMVITVVFNKDIQRREQVSKWLEEYKSLLCDLVKTAVSATTPRRLWN